MRRCVEGALKLAGAQVRDRHDVPAVVRGTILALSGRLADLSLPGGGGLRGVTAKRQQQTLAAAGEVRRSGYLADRRQLAHLGPAVSREVEVTSQRVCHPSVVEGEQKLGESAELSGETQPPVSDVEQGLVVPQAPGSSGAGPKGRESGSGIEVSGAQRLQRGAQRRHGGGVALCEPRPVPGQQQIGDAG